MASSEPETSKLKTQSMSTIEKNHYSSNQQSLNRSKSQTQSLQSTPKQDLSRRNSISDDVVNGPPIALDKWPDSPLMLCIHNRHKHYVHTNYDKEVAIPINKVFDLESNSFKGKCIVRIVDTPNCEKKYFAGRRRKSDISTQGVFKKRIRFDRVFTGQIFDRPFKNLPSSYLIGAGLKIVQTLAPSLNAQIDCDNPHLMSPWASACQTFNICNPGDEVPLPAEVTENLELLDPKFKGMTFTQRKTLFHDPKKLENYYFEPGFVYTMSFYSHMFSPKTYSLHMLRMKWGIQSYIPAPMQINAIILPDSSNIVDSCDDLIGTTTINSNLINEIMKERSAEADTDTNSDATETTDFATNTNSTNIDNSKNKTNIDDNNSNDSEDVTKGGRDRNEAVNFDTPSDTINNNNDDTKDSTTNTTDNTEDSVDEKIDTAQTGRPFDLLDCEMIYSFNIWHVKLVDELYNGKHNIDSSKSAVSLLTKKDETDATDSNDNETSSTESDKKRKGSKGSLMGIFSKKW